MAKYKVMTIAIAVKNNRIANFGELVDDSELTANPSEMIASGSIKLATEEVEVVDEEVLEPVKVETKEVVTEDVKTDKVEQKVPAKDKVKDALTKK